MYLNANHSTKIPYNLFDIGKKNHWNNKYIYHTSFDKIDSESHMQIWFHITFFKFFFRRFFSFFFFEIKKENLNAYFLLKCLK